MKMAQRDPKTTPTSALKVPTALTTPHRDRDHQSTGKMYIQ